MHLIDDIADTRQSLNQATLLRGVGDGKDGFGIEGTTVDLAPRAVAGDLRIESVDAWFDEFVASPTRTTSRSPLTPLRDRSPIGSNALLLGLDLARRFTTPVPGPVVVPLEFAELYTDGADVQ